jgi:hypothetical protein
MTYTDTQLSQCVGKEGFQSFGLANQVARRRKRTGKPGTPYKCPHCHQFHIGQAQRIHRRRYFK